MILHVPRGKRITLFSVLILIGSMAGFAGMSSAQQGAPPYPTKYISVLVGYAAGGAADLLARTMGEAAGKQLGQSIAVVNKPATLGTVAVSEAVHAKPDGYTLMLNSPSSLTIAPVTGVSKYSYRDVAPIAQVATDMYAVAVSKDSPFNKLSDIVTYAKANPKKVRYSTLGKYSLGDVAMVMFEQKVGIQMTHVPQKGGAPAVTAVMGGHVELAVVLLGTVFPQYKSGEVKILGLLAHKRFPDLPSVPTFIDQGFDISMETWHGLFGPKGTPDYVIRKWNEVLARLAGDPGFKTAVQNLSLSPSYLDAKAFATQVNRDGEENARIVQQIIAQEKK